MQDKVTIVFTKSKKYLPIFSWLVILFLRRNYSHVSRKLKPGFAENAAYYQASEGKVNYEIESVFLKKHEIVKTYTIQIPNDVLRQLNRMCWEEAGKKYGFLQNLGIVWVDICKHLGYNTKNPFKSGVNCSELLYLTMFKPLKPELDYDPETITPADIEDIILEYFNE